MFDDSVEEMFDDTYEEYDDASEGDNADVEEVEAGQTLENLLPANCIVISTKEGSHDPLISVRGKYEDLGEAVQILRYVTTRVQYYKHIQDKS